jgi:hypothetical protein
VLDVLFGFIGFKVPSAVPDEEAATKSEPAPDGAPQQAPTDA